MPGTHRANIPPWTALNVDSETLSLGCHMIQLTLVWTKKKDVLKVPGMCWAWSGAAISARVKLCLAHNRRRGGGGHHRRLLPALAVSGRPTVPLTSSLLRSSVASCLTLCRALTHDVAVSNRREAVHRWTHRCGQRQAQSPSPGKPRGLNKKPPTSEVWSYLVKISVGGVVEFSKHFFSFGKNFLSSFTSFY